MHFEESIKEFITLQKQYAEAYGGFQDYVKNNDFRHEYAKGGETLHRGFYSPSSLDLVVSGNGRGRLLKRAPKGSFSYEYLFDIDDKLVCANKYSDFFDGVSRLEKTEFLVYGSNDVLAFTYDSICGNTLCFISKCEYENLNIVRYETAFFPIPGESDCHEINVEEFEYENGLMCSDRWSYYFPGMGILHQNEFSFIRDDDGYISSFTVKSVNEPSAGPYRSFARRK